MPRPLVKRPQKIFSAAISCRINTRSLNILAETSQKWMVPVSRVVSNMVDYAIYNIEKNGISAEQKLAYRDGQMPSDVPELLPGIAAKQKKEKQEKQGEIA